MRVIYRNILNRLENARRQADVEGRSIERVELTREEFNQLADELENRDGFVTQRMQARGEVHYLGVKVVRV